ncbi:DUF4396 domain-containing protein [Kitasatospora cineracea]|uniref:Uncharacterized protein DUF4396 n=1 Tax=Kitasatospora cineracea TaxID=88074 RepID=A0A3N4RGG6_9ACTN|nr:DUF4396 domain-containing protein [Kitasatospora cineracea]RPE31906.1 uncharacterized protein DUF4396 [Kitasatospora cineracea]
MEAHTQPAPWLEVIGWLALGSAFVSVLAITVDIVARGHRQHMWIMNVVYPVTALYWGPAAWWFHATRGRRSARPAVDPHGPPDPDRLPEWEVRAKAVAHCGAGCTLGDLLAEWLVFATGATIFHRALYADFALDLAFAWLLGIAFQYFAIVPMREDLGVLRGLWAAIKADTLSILAFQVGLFLGMWLYQGVLFAPGLPKTSAAYWLMMQLSMILGFFTAWPVNGWLVRAGWKERM